jgi:2-polyprenyl-3-methyl-5-hydroxy-6-metoxy-1,4-benzoquinol methylase
MEFQLTSQDCRRIAESIRGKYVNVAKTPQGLFKYPTGREGLEALMYDPEMIGILPDEVASSYCGVGNPFALGPLNKGEKVLDIGCGAGVDSILAAMMVGSTGSVTGIDMVPEMLARAGQNLRLMNIRNVEFKLTSVEELPDPDNRFDVVISNGVFNLIIYKRKAVAEVFRVLKPGGRLMMADQVLLGEQDQSAAARVDNWFK